MQKIITLILFLVVNISYAQDTVSVIGVGDIMLGTNYPSKQYLPVNKGRNLLKTLNSTLRDADITFGNLEGTIINSGPTIKNCKKCYAFRMPEYLADNLVTAGFDVMSVANNHIRDFGQKGLHNTLNVLDNLGIHSAGLAKQRPTTSFVKNGIKYGFAAFAPNIGTVDIRDIANAKRIVKKLAANNDIVLVSFHGGAEGAKNQHVKNRNERFYGENRGNVYKFSHAVIDAGADIVFGHGPHVTRAIEIYKNRFIAYSLGNFCTYGRFNLRGVTGVAPIIKVNINKHDGSFVNAKITSIKQIKNQHVIIDPNNKALNIIRQLTKQDGFANNIKISNKGWVQKL